MRLLVAYGSKMGGTKGLAEMLGTELTSLGYEVDIRRGRDVSEVTPYDAVIVGGALYYFISWHKEARGVVKRHLADLRQRPVWLFSSGPLDDSATEKDIPPIKSVAKLIDRVGARGHVTFGGRLEKKSGDLPVGDWRSADHVRQWAELLDQELVAEKAG